MDLRKVLKIIVAIICTILLFGLLLLKTCEAGVDLILDNL